MAAALKSAGGKVPDYLTLVAAETNTKTQTATFAMHCYWEGEGLLGGIQGVNSTHSAWCDGSEVVDVQYDPAVVNYADPWILADRCNARRKCLLIRKNN